MKLIDRPGRYMYRSNQKEPRIKMSRKNHVKKIGDINRMELMDFTPRIIVDFDTRGPDRTRVGNGGCTETVPLPGPRRIYAVISQSHTPHGEQLPP